MLKIPNQFIYLKLLLMLTIFATCKDDDMTIDFCDNEEIQPISASFGTYQKLYMDSSDSTRDIKTDYFFTTTYIIFKADQYNQISSYQWSIGDDPRVFEQREFSLYFEEMNAPIEIQLIVEGNPITDCFPDDDGRDTILRTVYFVPFDSIPVLGRYRGVVHSVPNDTFEIEIENIPLEGPNINNLPNGCNREGFFRMEFQASYRDFVIPNLSNTIECPKPQGWGHLSDDNILEIEYSIYNADLDEVVSDFFKGIKIE